MGTSRRARGTRSSTPRRPMPRLSYPPTKRRPVGPVRKPSTPTPKESGSK
jgi:hypothetical protein